MAIPKAIQLAHVKDGSRVVVERISDDDSDLLQYFLEQGITVGAQLQITAGDPFSDTLEIQADSTREPLRLGIRATSSVWVSLQS